MFRIGLVGVESSHAEFFGELFNLEKCFPSFLISALWGGDSPERIQEVAVRLGIDTICDTIEELTKMVDAVMIILRKGSEHLKPALLAIEAGKPVFIDKPFTTELGHAQKIIKAANKHSIPVFGGSTLKFLPEILEVREKVKKEIDTVVIRYSADADSPYDGYCFYGSHLAELCITICGKDFVKVKAIKNVSGVCAVVEFSDKKAVLSSSPKNNRLHISLFGNRTQNLVIDENGCYRYGMKIFVDMLKTGKPPLDYNYLKGPVRLLQEIIDSYNR